MSDYLKLFRNQEEYDSSKSKGSYNHIIDDARLIVPIKIPCNMIKYEASSKLEETTYTGSYPEEYPGIHIYCFNTNILSHTFENGVGTLEFSDCVTQLRNGAFANCLNMTNIYLPDSITSIENSVFRSSYNLTSIDIPSGVTSIGHQAFYSCRSLTSITIPDSVTSIEYSAFDGCYGLTSIDIPDSVTSIGQGAFSSCRSLTSCTIGSGITSMGGYVFQNCASLTSLIINAVIPPTLGDNILANSTNCIIYVPLESINAYKTASGWNTYANRIQSIN